MKHFNLKMALNEKIWKGLLNLRVVFNKEFDKKQFSVS